jgi:mannosyltransferase OCH1-like enzyme
VFYLWNKNSARQFIEQNFSWFLPTYDSYRYSIQRIDALKYFLLWQYGGIYMDLDVSCRRPLDPFLEFSAWLPGTWPMGVSNDVMGAAPGHSIMRLLAESLQSHDKIYVSKYITVFWRTGPMFVNNVLLAWFREESRRATPEYDNTVDVEKIIISPESSPDIMRHRLHHLNDVAILPPMFYSETNYTFFGHRPGGSWHGEDVAIVAWIFERLWLLLGIFGCCAAIARISSIVLRRRTLSQEVLSCVA